MVYKIEQIEGVDSASGERLRAAGIATSAELLRACSDGVGRRSLAAAAGLDEALVARFANRADLMRIKGVGRRYADLLEGAGVDTVKELRGRNAARLVARMAEVNDSLRLARAIPAEKMVAGWIEQARQLPAVLG
jgi:predicted flap endonuclease-1-like 5' DNA nuclease